MELSWTLGKTEKGRKRENLYNHRRRERMLKKEEMNMKDRFPSRKGKKKEKRGKQKKEDYLTLSLKRKKGPEKIFALFQTGPQARKTTKCSMFAKDPKKKKGKSPQV